MLTQVLLGEFMHCLLQSVNKIPSPASIHLIAAQSLLLQQAFS